MNEALNFKVDQNLFDYQMDSVDGKSILITGGTTGIGRATAILLASQGAKVTICGRHDEELKTALADIRRVGGGQVWGLNADMTNPTDIKRIFQNVDEQAGGLDILINNAGVATESALVGNYNAWQYIIHTNLLAYIATAHEAVERMKARGAGHIVNIGSMSAQTREEGSSVYVATKAGIEGFSEALRKEVNEMGIKVTLIEPGAVGTDMQAEESEELRKQEREMKALKAEDIAVCIFYALTQPKRCDLVSIQIRPHLQKI